MDEKERMAECIEDASLEKVAGGNGEYRGMHRVRMKFGGFWACPKCGATSFYVTRIDALNLYELTCICGEKSHVEDACVAAIL